MKLGYFFAILAAVTWGVTYTIDEKLLRSSSPAVLLFLHGFFNMLIALPIVLYREGPGAFLRVVDDRSMLGLLVVAQILAALAGLFIYIGIDKLGAARSSIFEIAYPLFVVLFCWLAYGTKLQPSTLLGGGLIFAGSALIIFNQRMADEAAETAETPAVEAAPEAR